MGAVNTTYTFTPTDTITSTKMNDIIDQTTMTSDAVLDGSGGSGGLDIAFGKLSISANAINSSRLATNSVISDKIMDGAVTQAKASNMLLPSGAIMAFAMNSVPTGWLAANGSAVSRTTYSNLFLAIGTLYGSGDGTATFNLPDLRGYFVRGSGTNSDGTASGTFGVKISDTFKSHLHSVDPPLTTTSSNGDHAHTITAGQQTGTSSGCGMSNVFQKGQDTSCGTVTTNTTGDHTHTVQIAPFNSNSTGGSETAPRHIAMLYCIKI
jgi:microcystin-dependent protein